MSLTTRAYTHAAEFWQERRADDALVGGSTS